VLELDATGTALTGRMVDQPWGDICDGEEKRKMLCETCERIGISPEQAIAMGDGANDLPMMAVAGLSVAYHAKPKVREQAKVAINEGGLDRLLDIVRPGGPAPQAAQRGLLAAPTRAAARASIAAGRNSPGATP
jgi:phosphoserine phosphatase